MILLWAIIAGFVAGLSRAIVGKRPYRAPNVRRFWLVLLAFLPQFFAFRLETTRNIFPDQYVPVVLVGSQAILLIFTVANITVPGFWVLGLGLVLNFLVILANRGMMPISPEVVQRILPSDLPPGLWSVGRRFGVGKDIVLEKGDTNLWVLSDIFVIRLSETYRVAFSIGDVLIALGAFWILWNMGAPRPASDEEQSNTDPNARSILQEKSK